MNRCGATSKDGVLSAPSALLLYIWSKQLPFCSAKLLYSRDPCSSSSFLKKKKNFEENGYIFQNISLVFSFQTINFFIKEVCILKKVHLFWSTTAKFCPMSFTATFEANLFPCFRWQFKTCLTPPSSSLLDSYWCLFQTTNISLLP